MFYARGEIETVYARDRNGIATDTSKVKMTVYSRNRYRFLIVAIATI